MNRIDRLMGTLLLLQSKRVIRAEDIAEHFDISLRTVYRDVAALSEIGVPVAAEAGVGYSLMKGYLLPPIMFSEEEAAALGMAAMSLRKTSDPSLDASMQSALLKVKAALPIGQRDRLERVEKSVVFGWSSHAKKPEGKIVSLVDLQRCLAESKALKITYRTGGRGEVTSRVVEPLGLIHYLDYWHMIAWCRLREDYRDFRLDRIQKLDVLEEHSVRHGEFDLQRYLEEQRADNKSVEVAVFFASSSVDRAKREWSLGLVSEEEMENGSVLTLTTGACEWMVGWLLSFGTQASILGPVELKELVREEAVRLTEHHASAYSEGAALLR